MKDETVSQDHEPSICSALDRGDRLLFACDHIFNPDDWEATFNSDDICELAEAAEITWGNSGKIATVGRLKRMRNVYAVNVATAWDDDGEPEDWDVMVFGSKRAATSAYKASLKAPPSSAEQVAVTNPGTNTESLPNDQ